MPFDLSPQEAPKSLKRIAALMGRAGQPVVQTAFNDKLRRTSGVTYREAMLTLASGQAVTLRVSQSGDIAQVLLNGSLVPIHQQTDPNKAIGEIASIAEANQGKFQKAQARIKAELPAGIRTTAPRMVDALKERVVYLDKEIAERQETVQELTNKLSSPVLDAVETVVTGASPTPEALAAAAAADESLAIVNDSGVKAVISLPKEPESDQETTVAVPTDDGQPQLLETGGEPVVTGEEIAQELEGGEVLDGAEGQGREKAVIGLPKRPDSDEPLQVTVNSEGSFQATSVEQGAKGDDATLNNPIP
ncbi:hypothetical protein [Pseudomonas sp.]|jgi:hypothetical protein|uniref:defense against restriction DarA-related protein n=1 Tax=Pseudomonas sp. TaxID=306 RepID=UPI002ED9D39F